MNHAESSEVKMLVGTLSDWELIFQQWPNVECSGVGIGLGYGDAISHGWGLGYGNLGFSKGDGDGVEVK